MNDVDSRPGNIVIGIMLVLVGLAVALQRAGTVSWGDQWTLWPLILGGIGLARFVQSPPGTPRQGLLFLTAAAWILIAEAGWVSFEDSWPVLIIVFGLIIALNGGVRRRWYAPDPPGTPSDLPGDPSDRAARRLHRREMRRRERPLGGLAVIGIWIAIVIALQASGARSFGDWGTFRDARQTSTSDRLRVVSVMGRSEHVSRSTAFHGGSVTQVMGRAEVDLREAVLAAGDEASIEIVSLMGTVEVRVPRDWTVDTGPISAIGDIRDNRPPAVADGAGAAAGLKPRLVLRGLVAMGRLVITS